jgi:hypothetical protein
MGDLLDLTNAFFIVLVKTVYVKPIAKGLWHFSPEKNKCFSLLVWTILESEGRHRFAALAGCLSGISAGKRLQD